MYKFVLNLSLVFATACVSQGCFPSKEATSISIEIMREQKVEIVFPTRVVLMDGGIVLFPGGIKADRDSLSGVGQRYTMTGIQTGQSLPLTIPMDSVAAITKYELKSSAGHVIASVLHGIVGGVMTPLSVYCVSCPKCCFGSCPTVYTNDGNGYNLETELFSHCISKQLEEDDFDLLNQPVSDDGQYSIRITNEAMETHYINKFSLFAVHHPADTKLFLSEKGYPLAIKTVTPPIKAFDRTGNDVLRIVETSDNLAYRSGEQGVAKMMGGDYADWLDVRTNVPDGAKRVRMVMRLRNTLLSTVLLYDIVLGSQGLDALNWTERMDTDPVYATYFREIYKAFSGIVVSIGHANKWTQFTSIKDVGPLAWKTVAVEIPVDRAGELSVRLQFVSDNFMIDMIAFDAASDSVVPLMIEQMPPTEVRDNSATLRADVVPLIGDDDDQYLVTNPGESYRLTYAVRKKTGLEVTMLAHSKGYYTEWIRGSWIRDRNSTYRFDLYKIDQTMIHLAQSWLENKKSIEERFFNTRIPIREIP